MRIVVVVPTIREDSYYDFINAWGELFRAYGVVLVKVQDGEVPEAQVLDFSERTAGFEVTPDIVFSGFGRDAFDLIPNFSPACRNLGFAVVAKYMLDVDVVITLDDDVRPGILGGEDTIAQHLNALTKRVTTTWLNTMGDGLFPRGFPYSIRQESPVMLSHGVWVNVPDWDAPTQLAIGEEGWDEPLTFHRGVVPKGTYFPMCGMNVAFRPELLPAMYYAPVNNFAGCQRFDDIWAGIHIKDFCDANSYGVVTGYSVCEHIRASDVFKNLQQEAVGLKVNETYYLDHGRDYPAFRDEYATKRRLWKDCVTTWRRNDFESDQEVSNRQDAGADVVCGMESCVPTSPSGNGRGPNCGSDCSA